MKTETTYSDYSEITERFLTTLRNLQRNHSNCIEVVHRKDLEDLDLLHAIEFEPHYKTRARLSTKLHLVRLERRRAKNFLQDYQNVVDFLEKNKSMVDRLEKLLELLKKAEEPKQRKYRPRVLEDEVKTSS